MEWASPLKVTEFSTKSVLQNLSGKKLVMFTVKGEEMFWVTINLDLSYRYVYKQITKTKKK